MPHLLPGRRREANVTDWLLYSNPMAWRTGSTSWGFFETPSGRVEARRKGQRVRFLDERGRQVGPEHKNVAPAFAWAEAQGWRLA